MDEFEHVSHLIAVATALFLFGIIGFGGVIAIVGSWVVTR